MKSCLNITVIAAAILGSAAVYAEQVSVSVTIENLAPANGTNQTPHWVGFHDGDRFDIYNGGEAANFLPVLNDPNNSVERLAEDGNTAPLSETFKSLVPEGVDDTIPGPNGALVPGEITQQMFVLDSTNPNHRYFSYASMLLPSNDFWYANGNPKTHMIFDAGGNFVAKDFIVTRDRILDAGTEENTEIPAQTAFFGQQVPNTGVDENGVIRDFDVNDAQTYFKRPGSGGILDDPRFVMADFLLDGYPLVKISFNVKMIDASGLELEITPSPDDFTNAGETITYNYKVTNNTSSPLSGVGVIDPLVGGPVCGDVSLYQGITVVCTQVYVTTQSDVDAGRINNTATASSNETGNAQGSATVVRSGS